MSRHFSELGHYQVHPQARRLLPLEYCLEHLVVPLGDPAARPLGMGMIDPGDRTLLGELSATLDRKLEPVQLNAFEVRKALAELHGLPRAQHGIALKLEADRTFDFSPDRRAPDLLDDVLSVAVRRAATDVHIEVYRDDVDLRYRVDGFLRQVTSPLSPDNVQRVISRLKVLCDLDLVDRYHPQNGHFSAVYVDGEHHRRVDFRLSVVPGPYGEDAVVRVLDPIHFRLDLNELGMPPAQLARFRRLVHYPDGLLLCVGPTASGKTNTLYASLGTLRERGIKIVTCEEPIEYEFDKINQKQVTPDVGYADWVRAFLRQNPDLLLVGEVRDAQTAETVIQAATTGHMVLSTLHTRNAVSAIVRMRTLGAHDDFLAHTLVGILSQRLVARNCRACREPYQPDPELVQAYFGAEPPTRFQRGAGCEACDGTGYQGLLALFELLEMDRALAAAVGRGATGDELLSVALEQGFQPLLTQALERARAGETTLEELARRIEPKQGPAWDPTPGRFSEGG